MNIIKKTVLHYLQIKVTLVNSVHNIIIIICIYVLFKLKNNKIIPKLFCIKINVKNGKQLAVRIEEFFVNKLKFSSIC